MQGKAGKEEAVFWVPLPSMSPNWHCSMMPGWEQEDIMSPTEEWMPEVHGIHSKILLQTPFLLSLAYLPEAHSSDNFTSSKSVYGFPTAFRFNSKIFSIQDIPWLGPNLLISCNLHGSMAERGLYVHFTDEKTETRFITCPRSHSW